jgi:ArsR family transcriptional regulator
MKTDKHVSECRGGPHHPESIAMVKKTMPGDPEIGDLSSFFKICGDPTRIRILYALSASELCVCDIADLLGMTMSSISHQLRLLKQARMVSSRKKGQMVYYRAADRHVKSILDQGMKHLTE